MRFHVRKRRQAPAIIIVALIDILVVLLIFLVVTTTFKHQAAVKITLPDSTSAKKTGAHENPPLMVTIDATGNLRLGADPKPISLEQLKAGLTAAATRNSALRVGITGDKSAPWGLVLKVMDLAKELKLKDQAVTVSAVEPPKK